MRLLLLETDEAVRSFLPEILDAWLCKKSRGRKPQIVVEDGNQVDYRRAVSLLKKEYEFILLNLRLPAMLSLRIAELAHLAKMPSQVVLVSGAPQDLGPGLSLFDGYIRIPFYEKTADSSLEETLGRPFVPEHRLLPTQDHVDISILNLLQRYDALVPGARGALHAFGLYRDAYLHRPASNGRLPALSPRATLSERLDYFAEVQPLEFTVRLRAVMEAINGSRFFLPKQKRFLVYQFNYLLDAIGLTLMNFRDETEAVLKGLEQFGRMAETGVAEIDAGSLRGLLLRHSDTLSYVREGVEQIIGLLPGTG